MSLLISGLMFTCGLFQEGRNMKINQDSCESNEHKELKMICVKEEEPDDDEYLCESSLGLNNKQT